MRKKKATTRQNKKKRNYKQGTYEVKNWDKYLGTKNPRYLSSYELEVFQFLDDEPSIEKWGAEIVIVEYFNPVKEKKSRYIVDVYVEYVNKNGDRKKKLIEIKPSRDIKRPFKTRNKRQTTFEEEMRTWAVNRTKWEAAHKYASERGWEFEIFTEKQIFGK